MNAKAEQVSINGRPASELRNPDSFFSAQLARKLRESGLSKLYTGEALQLTGTVWAVGQPLGVKFFTTMHGGR